MLSKLGVGGAANATGMVGDVAGSGRLAGSVAGSVASRGLGLTRSARISPMSPMAPGRGVTVVDLMEGTVFKEAGAPTSSCGASTYTPWVRNPKVVARKLAWGAPASSMQAGAAQGGAAAAPTAARPFPLIREAGAKNVLTEKEMAKRRKARDKQMAQRKKERDRKKKEAVKAIYQAPVVLDKYGFATSKHSYDLDF